MRGQPQVLNLRLEHGEPCGPRARVAQYPHAIIAAKVDLIFGCEVAGIAALQSVKGPRLPGRFPEAVPFRMRYRLKVEKNGLGGFFLRGENLESRIKASGYRGRGQHPEIQTVEPIGMRAPARAHDLDCSSWDFPEGITPGRTVPEMRYISVYRGRGSRASRNGTPSLSNQQWPTNSSLTWPMPKHKDTFRPSRRKK